MHTFLTITSLVLACVSNTYMVSGLILMVTKEKGKKQGFANFLWKVTKWPCLASVFAQPVLDVLLHGHLNWWDGPLVALNFYIWWCYRNAGDDDWTKKLKKKITEKVAEIEGKLVVVPQAA